MNLDEYIKSGDFEKDDNYSSETSENVSRETSDKPRFNFLRTASVDKPIESYLQHPLNKNNDEDFGRGLRGVDAFIGDTNLAVIDLLGFVKYIFKIKKKKVVSDE